jgi:hypothetical protein
LRRFQLPHLRGEVQGRHARFVCGVDLSACVQQLAGGVDVAVAGSVVQRRAAVALRNNKIRQGTLGGRRGWQGGGGTLNCALTLLALSPWLSSCRTRGHCCSRHRLTRKHRLSSMHICGKGVGCGLEGKGFRVQFEERAVHFDLIKFVVPSLHRHHHRLPCS